MALSPTSSGKGSPGSGSTAPVFSLTLGADAASLDTLANGIPATGSILEIVFLARTDDAAAVGAIGLTLNNDGGANYDVELVNGTNAAVTAGPTLAATSFSLAAHGSGGGASFASVIRVLIPGYALTTFFKAGEATSGVADSAAANASGRLYALNYRSTAAISRAKFAVAGAATVFRAGTSMFVYVR